MTQQFTIKNFARGVKLTVNHVYTPASGMKNTLQSAAIEGQPTMAPFKMNWCFSPQSMAYSYDGDAFPEAERARMCLPMIFPPPQTTFDAATQAYDFAPVIKEMSISFDQRANPYGISDEWIVWPTRIPAGPVVPLPGMLVDIPYNTVTNKSGLSRYDTTIKLIQKVPTCFDVGGNSVPFIEILTLELPGEALFGTTDFNPFVIDGLNQYLNPYAVYYWTVQTLGLYEFGSANLAMPNFNLVCSFEAPLTPRDSVAGLNPSPSVVDPYVQNIPTKHQGLPQHGTMTFPATPAAGAVITGDDVQSVITDLEAPILDKLRAGYGRDPGSESDTFPWEQLANDAGYQVINVPMFANWWNVVGHYIDFDPANLPAGAGFPYVTAPGVNHGPICDQRIISIPTGFVVHHVVVCQNTYPYGTNTPGLLVSPGSQVPTGNTFLQKVGVGLYNGNRSDELTFAQVAYLEWTPANQATWLIDKLQINPNSISYNTNYILMNAPISWAVQRLGKSYTDTGAPYFIGAGNSTTQDRTLTANLPFAFGGNNWTTPGTFGMENLLVVRWSMEDSAVAGLGANSGKVLTGWGGHQVIIIGKQSTVGSDTNGKVVSSNPVVGTW